MTLREFFTEMLRRRAQDPDPAISVEAQRVLDALAQGKRATMRPMPPPQPEEPRSEQ